VVIGKEVGQGKMDAGPHTEKKKRVSWAGLEIWPMVDLGKRNTFLFIFQIFIDYKLI
jgi:hypothetical protein